MTKPPITVAAIETCNLPQSILLFFWVIGLQGSHLPEYIDAGTQFLLWVYDSC